MSDEQTSGGDESDSPVAPAGQANSTAALADAAPAAPEELVPATETSAFTILAGIAAILTVGVAAIALTWYLLKETPEKEPRNPLLTTKKTITKPTPSPGVRGPPMICTYNIEKFSKKSPLPSDGLCDQIYLDSVCRDLNCSRGIRWTLTGALPEFLEVLKTARTANKTTRFGLALDSHASNMLSIFDNEDKRRVITEDMWNTYKCSHYASLQNNIRSFSDPALASELWTQLLLLREQLKNLRGVQDDFGLVLGVTSTDIPSMVRQVLEDYKRTPPYWTNFIIISHTSFANYALPPYDDKLSFDLTNCYIVPPTIHNYNSHYNQTYYGTLEDSSKFLQKLLNASQNVPVSVSVTLKGRWFTSERPPDQNRELFKKCTNFNKTTDASPDSVCVHKLRGKYFYNKNYESAFFNDSTRVFTFDTEEALRAKKGPGCLPNEEVTYTFPMMCFKVCALYILSQMCAYKERAKQLHFGIAVYDIDADASSDPCNETKYTGQYKRLKLLRKLNGFMEKYTNKKDCESVS
ncbi:uncharacterized protein [Dermacentor albipictus]|uniref:uncharacterized protein isoform X2 n=1 Tax=Dermacentor albipictus TaxID=60249 RepID=UPI0031FCD5ED